MDDNPDDALAHPTGELPAAGQELAADRSTTVVHTLGGKLFVRWDPDEAVTSFGPVAYCIEFPRTNELRQQWVNDCPLAYRSPNAPPKQDILGTPLLRFATAAEMVNRAAAPEAATWHAPSGPRQLQRDASGETSAPALSPSRRRDPGGMHSRTRFRLTLTGSESYAYR